MGEDGDAAPDWAGLRQTSIAVLRGATNITLDAKGRLAIPTRYRERLAARCDGQLVVTVDRDRCLLLYPFPDWDDIERKLMRLPNLDRRARRLQRLILGHATELELDGNGRILLPRELRDFAGLDRSVMLIGQGNKFELWDEEIWGTKCNEWLGDEDDADLSAELESLSL